MSDTNNNTHNIYKNQDLTDNFNPNYWLEDDKCYYSTYEQGTPEWYNLRNTGVIHKTMVTASNFGTIAGRNNFKNREDYLLEMKGLKDKPELTEESKAHIARGNYYEPIARLIYQDFKGCKVKEVGLAVPKFDIRIGASVDGLVDKDGCIEIKCPSKMYDQSYIFDSHYDQMQGGMACTGRKWCDYVNFCPKTNEFSIRRIDFNEDYWNNNLYPKLCQFLSDLEN